MNALRDAEALQVGLLVRGDHRHLQLGRGLGQGALRAGELLGLRVLALRSDLLEAARLRLLAA